jgi:DNA helicase INO80
MSRLHMILKPFMLRRIKKDVEHELSDKLEVLVYCPLTIRQKLLYMGLKKKIKIEDLLQGLGSQSQNSSLATSLMNLVMQFRKVCNHPELFERREARSPFAMSVKHYLIPKIVCHENINMGAINSKKHILGNKLCIFNPLNVHKSLSGHGKTGKYIYAISILMS